MLITTVYGHHVDRTSIMGEIPKRNSSFIREKKKENSVTFQVWKKWD